MHTFAKQFVSIMILLAVIGLTRATASAAVSLLQVNGVFEATQSEDESGLNTFAPLEGQPFSLVFTYDPSVPDDTDDVLNFGRYNHTIPPNQMVLTSGGVTISEPSIYPIQASNSGFSSSVAGRSLIVDSTGLTVPVNVEEFNFGFIIPISAGAPDFLDLGAGNDPLPETPFFLSQTLTDAFVFVGMDLDVGNDVILQDSINGTITSITIIPEPVSMALLGVGALALVARGGSHNLKEPTS